MTTTTTTATATAQQWQQQQRVNDQQPFNTVKTYWLERLVLTLARVTRHWCHVKYQNPYVQPVNTDCVVSTHYYYYIIMCFSLRCTTMHGVGVIILDRTALLLWTL